MKSPYFFPDLTNVSTEILQNPWEFPLKSSVSHHFPICSPSFPWNLRDHRLLPGLPPGLRQLRQLHLRHAAALRHEAPEGPRHGVAPLAPRARASAEHSMGGWWRMVNDQWIYSEHKYIYIYIFYIYIYVYLFILYIYIYIYIIWWMLMVNIDGEC